MTLNKVRTLFNRGQTQKGEEYNNANNALKINHLGIEIKRSISSHLKTVDNVDGE